MGSNCPSPCTIHVSMPSGSSLSHTLLPIPEGWFREGLNTGCHNMDDRPSSPKSRSPSSFHFPMSYLLLHFHLWIMCVWCFYPRNSPYTPFLPLFPVSFISSSPQKDGLCRGWWFLSSSSSSLGTFMHTHCPLLGSSLVTYPHPYGNLGSCFLFSLLLFIWISVPASSLESPVLSPCVLPQGNLYLSVLSYIGKLPVFSSFITLFLLLAVIPFYFCLPSDSFPVSTCSFLGPSTERGLLGQSGDFQHASISMSPSMRELAVS